MKPLYILHGKDLRPGKASLDEIRDVVEGGYYYSNARLARVSADAEGDVTITALTSAEIDEVRASLAKCRADAIVATLDHLLAAHRTADSLRSVTVDNFTVHPEHEPGVEKIVRTWAAANGLHVVDAPVPAEGDYWYPRIEVKLDDTDWKSVVVVQFPRVELGERAVAAEAVTLAVTSLAEKTIGEDYSF